MVPIIEINWTSLLVALGMIVISVSIILVMAKLVLYELKKKEKTIRDNSAPNHKTYLVKRC